MKILLFIYRITALTLAAISFILVFPAYFLVFQFSSEDEKVHRAHRISQLWAKMMFACMGARVNIRNAEVLKPDTKYVFVANHRSLLDVPLFSLSCAHTFRFLSKKELSRIPVMGYVLRNIYITVSRNNISDRQRSIARLKESLNSGVSVFICPEGTRNAAPEHLLPFKDGAFFVAVECQVPIAVLTVLNSEQLMPPRNFFDFRPGTIEAVWSEPISTEGLAISDVEMLKDRVRNQMMGHLSKAATEIEITT